MHVVTDALMPPYHCIISGSGNGPFIDTLATVGVDAQRVYIKETQVEALARVLHMPSRTVWANAQEKLKGLERDNKRLTEALKNADAIIDGFELATEHFAKRKKETAHDK